MPPVREKVACPLFSSPASQLPAEHRHEQIGDPAIADAILDRLIHNAHKINLSMKGDSLRKKYVGLT